MQGTGFCQGAGREGGTREGDTPLNSSGQDGWSRS